MHGQRMFGGDRTRMRLDELVNGMEGITEVRGDPSVELTELTCDSRRVMPGSLFVAVPGELVDGAGFVGEALDRGACAVVAPAGAVNRTDCVVVEVEEVAAALEALGQRRDVGDGHRLEQAPLDARQREQRQEHQDDDQRAREDRLAHFG